MPHPRVRLWRQNDASLTIFRRCDEALFIEMLKLGPECGGGNGSGPTRLHVSSRLLSEEKRACHTIGGGPARTSRLPAWLAGLTTPSCSIRSIREAARL